jgi:nucleoside-diphosphate-sugar epimerase
MKSVLVIGGNGFIGRHLIEKLKLELFEVSALIRTSPEFPLDNCEYFKIEDLLKRKELRFDVIINVAMLRSATSQNQQLVYNSNFMS